MSYLVVICQFHTLQDEGAPQTDHGLALPCGASPGRSPHFCFSLPRTTPTSWHSTRCTRRAMSVSVSLAKVIAVYATRQAVRAHCLLRVLCVLVRAYDSAIQVGASLTMHASKLSKAWPSLVDAALAMARSFLMLPSAKATTTPTPASGTPHAPRAPRIPNAVRPTHTSWCAALVHDS